MHNSCHSVLYLFITTWQKTKKSHWWILQLRRIFGRTEKKWRWQVRDRTAWTALEMQIICIPGWKNGTNIHLWTKFTAPTNRKGFSLFRRGDRKKNPNQSSLEAMKKAAEWIDSEILWLNGQETAILGYRKQEISGRNREAILQPKALKQTEALTEYCVLFWSPPLLKAV